MPWRGCGSHRFRFFGGRSLLKDETGLGCLVLLSRYGHLRRHVQDRRIQRGRPRQLRALAATRGGDLRGLARIILCLRAFIVPGDRDRGRFGRRGGHCRGIARPRPRGWCSKRSGLAWGNIIPPSELGPDRQIHRPGQRRVRSRGAAVSDGAGLAAFASAESAASSGRDAMPAGVSFVLFSSDMGITTDMTARSPALSAAPCPKPVQKPRAMRLFFLRLGLTPSALCPIYSGPF